MRYWCLALVLAAAAACGNSTTSWDSSLVGGPSTSQDGAVTVLLDSKLAVDLDPCASASRADLEVCNYYLGIGKKYDLSLGVDAGSCDGRPTVPCDGSCGAGPTLYSQMMDLIHPCISWPVEGSLAVAFSQGCAQQVSLAYSATDNDAIAACIIAALSVSRFACAEQAPCWNIEYSSAP